ncbi:MAG: hypothetical protein K2K23_10665 [Muribaculaceae bacterium]|nr:hypothetical protein [Muribaculaceae bacterium]
MLKKFFASCLLGSAMISAMATESAITFSYAGDEYAIWGKGKSEIYDSAIRIVDPALVGKKITSIRAVLNAYEGIESTSMWLSKELKLEKIDGVKVTVPDVCAAEVTPEKISLPGSEDSFGQISTTLSEPYVITEDGIYVGYSFTVPAVEKGQVLSNKQQYPLLLSPCDNPNSLYIRASKDFLKWVSYNDKLGAAAMIYVTIEGEFPEYSVGIKSVPTTYAPLDKDFNIKAVISTPGIKDVTSIGYTYTVDGKSFDRTLEFDSPIASNFVNGTSVDIPIAAWPELGEFTVDLAINKVNGMDNENPGSSASCALKVLPFVPKHRPMLEEFTGTWCGWCTRGYFALEQLNELYGDNVVLAAYHDGDPMQVTSEFPVSFSGFPNSTLNRNGTEDPYYGNTTDGFGMKKEVIASMETVVPADISVDAVWANEEKTKINVSSAATFFENKENAGYKVGYLLINNGLTGEDESWWQSNYFPGSAVNYIGTELEVLTKWPSKVPDLIFNDVVVDVNGMKGVDDSVPADIEFNKPYASEFSYDIASNDVIQDKDKLYVAAFIINPNGTILNANKVKVVDASGVKSVGSDAEEVSAEFFNLSGMSVAQPQNGIFVKVAKLSDGSLKTSKVIVK